jgi:hypothetical protein
MTDYRNLSKQRGAQSVYNVVLSSRDLIGSTSKAVVRGKKNGRSAEMFGRKIRNVGNWIKTVGNVDPNCRKFGLKLKGTWISTARNLDQNCTEHGYKLQ